MKSRGMFSFSITPTHSCLFLAKTFSSMDLMERYAFENSISRFMVLRPVVASSRTTIEEMRAVNGERGPPR